MEQIKVKKSTQSKPVPKPSIDLRSPSGKVLPY